jgi:hypothetical protein
MLPASLPAATSAAVLRAKLDTNITCAISKKIILILTPVYVHEASAARTRQDHARSAVDQMRRRRRYSFRPQDCMRTSSIAAATLVRIVKNVLAGSCATCRGVCLPYCTHEQVDMGR